VKAGAGPGASPGTGASATTPGTTRARPGRKAGKVPAVAGAGGGGFLEEREKRALREAAEQASGKG
jgi:ribosomal protein L25 (general stress protein Ctc)